jgi:hypothetical protein
MVSIRQSVEERGAHGKSRSTEEGGPTEELESNVADLEVEVTRVRESDCT